jgi:hypothetical protein
MVGLGARKPAGQAGYAMGITLLVLFLLSIALALVGFSLSIRLRLVKAETEAVVRGALADAALDEAVANLAVDWGYDGASRHDLNEGQIESQVVDMGSRRYRVRAVGTYVGKGRAIQATVYRSSWGEVSIESWRLVDPDSDPDATPP